MKKKYDAYGHCPHCKYEGWHKQKKSGLVYSKGNTLLNVSRFKCPNCNKWFGFIIDNEIDEGEDLEIFYDGKSMGLLKEFVGFDERGTMKKFWKEKEEDDWKEVDNAISRIHYLLDADCDKYFNDIEADIASIERICNRHRRTDS